VLKFRVALPRMAAIMFAPRLGVGLRICRVSPMTSRWISVLGNSPSCSWMSGGMVIWPSVFIFINGRVFMRLWDKSSP
jgi:hypothetical protein